MAVEQTATRALRHVFCPRLLTIAEKVVRRCKACQMAQPRPKPQKGFLYVPLEGFPFQRISIDFVVNNKKTKLLI